MSLDAAYYLIAAWLFVLGATFGSFLNVVVYRVPLGMSLIEPGSHCPACKHPIRWYDNVPILGWIVLCGRCRDCGSPIAMRYPLVEALTAAMFLVLGASEYLSSGANLPLRATALPDAVIFPAWTFGEAGGIYAYHLLLLCTLLAAALIELDRRRVPARLMAPAWFVGLLAPLVWPRLHPVPAWKAVEGWLAAVAAAVFGPGDAAAGWAASLAGLVDGLTGLAIGLGLGWLASRAADSRHRVVWLMCPACVGLFLGWQAAGVVTIVVAAICVLQAASSRLFPRMGRIGPAGWMTLATLAWVMEWSRLAVSCPLVAWIQLDCTIEWLYAVF